MSGTDPSRPVPPGADGVADDRARRQYVRFLFLKVDPAWRRLDRERQEAGKRAVERVVAAFADRMLMRAYTTVGTRADVDLLLWQVSPNLENFGQLVTALFGTPLGPYLATPYAYLAMTKRSIYTIPEGQESDTNRHLTIQPGQAKYLFVYPFVKSRAWYALSFEERQEMMTSHIVVGRKYPAVKLNTTYSFGLDDQEFVVAFETDEPGDFLDLVMDLRETRASGFTERDVPIFTCVATSLRGALDALGTAGAAVAAPADLHEPLTSPAVPAPAGPDGWAPVLAADDLAVGSAEVVFAHGDQIAVFRTSEGMRAISNRCSHARGPLADGLVADGLVTCPWHGGRFDLSTGQAVTAPAAAAVPAYDVRVHEGRIELRPRVAEAEPEAAAGGPNPGAGRAGA